MPVEGKQFQPPVQRSACRAPACNAAPNANPVRRPLRCHGPAQPGVAGGRVAANCARSAPFAPALPDLAPAEIYAACSTRCVYHCSVSTMYRLLAANNEVLVRRKQLRHPIYTRNRNCWRCAPMRSGSWDITKLKGPAKWTYFYLFTSSSTFFSRRVVGWCVADDASACLFKALFDDTIAKHQVRRANSPCMPTAAAYDVERRRPRSCLPISASPNPCIAGCTRLKRQSVLGKSLPDPEISANLSVTTFGCMEDIKPSVGRFSPGIISAHSSRRPGFNDARPGPLRTDRPNPRRPSRSRWTAHSKPTPSGSSKGRQYRQQSQSPSGSTHPKSNAQTKGLN